MKKLNLTFLCLGLMIASLTTGQASAQQTRVALPAGQKIAVVNTKKCLEQSKVGKQEQVNFEKMKTQMESVLHEKEKTLEEIETKLNDDDYMDSISEQAAEELKRKKRTIRQEGYQLQNQYMQTLQQANMKVIQKIQELINKASAEVAKESGSLEFIFNDEAATYFKPEFDISDKVIAAMDRLFDAEQAAQPKPAVK